MGTLYLVATPIGNLEDVTLRALRVLAEVRLIAAEDTRQTRKLLTRYQIRTPLLSYHEHNKLVRVERLLETLEQGEVALVSDAGTPGLSDPGYELVRAALAAGHKVLAVPGPAAPIAALVASGLPTDSFVFLGYLPRRAAERRRLLEEVAGERRTLIAFEVPHRLRQSLADLERLLGAERPAAIGRELTKVHEETVRGSLSSLRRRFEAAEPRGEFTLIVGGAGEASRWGEARVRSELRRSRADGLAAAEAARRISAASGWPRREVYRMALEGR